MSATDAANRASEERAREILDRLDSLRKEKIALEHELYALLDEVSPTTADRIQNHLWRGVR